MQSKNGSIDIHLIIWILVEASTRRGYREHVFSRAVEMVEKIPSQVAHLRLVDRGGSSGAGVVSPCALGFRGMLYFRRVRI